MASQDKLKDEIASFEGLWEGGYYEGDPLSFLGKSSYGSYGYVSTLHATYLRCIKPYVNAETVALEIGPGRGGWTKALLPAKEIWVLDALSAEHNKFFEYLNHPKNVRYIQVEDFKCAALPENHFDYMFSFGCLCHVSFEGVSEYAENIFGKLKSGANCFWMIADKRKYQNFRHESESFNVWKRLAPEKRNLAPLKWMFGYFAKKTETAFLQVDDFDSKQGQWHDAGTERTCRMLEKIGYKIIDSDVGTIPRDPIIHFIKP